MGNNSSAHSSGCVVNGCDCLLYYCLCVCTGSKMPQLCVKLKASITRLLQSWSILGFFPRVVHKQCCQQHPMYGHDWASNSVAPNRQWFYLEQHCCWPHHDHTLGVSGNIVASNNVA